MAKTKITIRTIFSADFVLEKELGGFYCKTREQRLRQVLLELENLTGLGWCRSQIEDNSDISGNEEHESFTIAHPLPNKGKVGIFWEWAK